MSPVPAATEAAASARLLGHALEDPAVLDQLDGQGTRPDQLGGGELQAGFALLRHLRDSGRLTEPGAPGVEARIQAAAANLHLIGDWVLTRRRRLAARSLPGRGVPVRVPSGEELLLDAAARITLVWWFELWESCWPPAPELGVDLARRRREQALDCLVALGTRMSQRAAAGVADPPEIVEDALAALDRLDPNAIGSYLAGRSATASAHGRVAATTRPYPDSPITETTAPVCGACSTCPSPR